MQRTWCPLPAPSTPRLPWLPRDDYSGADIDTSSSPAAVIVPSALPPAGVADGVDEDFSAACPDTTTGDILLLPPRPPSATTSSDFRTLWQHKHMNEPLVRVNCHRQPSVAVFSNQQDKKALSTPRSFPIDHDIPRNITLYPVVAVSDGAAFFDTRRQEQVQPLSSSSPVGPTMDSGVEEQLTIMEEMTTILHYLTGLKSSCVETPKSSWEGEEESSTSQGALVTTANHQYGTNGDYPNDYDDDDDNDDDNDDDTSSFMLDPTMHSCQSSITYANYDDDGHEETFGKHYSEDMDGWDDLSFLFEPEVGSLKPTWNKPIET
jgi:hypothetical protein